MTPLKIVFLENSHKLRAGSRGGVCMAYVLAGKIEMDFSEITGKNENVGFRAMNLYTINYILILHYLLQQIMILKALTSWSVRI